MRQVTRGFIPLVAIVLLGLVAIAGAAIAAVSIQHKIASKEAVTDTSTPEQMATTTGAAYSAPVQARVQSSGTGTSQSAPDALSTPVAAIVRQMDTETAQDCQEAQSDFADVKANGVAESADVNGDQIQASQQEVADAKNAESLLGTIVNLCNTLKKPSPNTADGDTAFANQEASVKAQFALYMPNSAQQ